MSSDTSPPDASGWPPQRGVLSERINDRLWFADHDGYRAIYGSWGEPLYHASLDDKVELRLIAVSLRSAGLVTQEDIAWAFGHSVETQRRWERAYEKDGLKGLIPKHQGGHAKVSGSQEAMVKKWFEDGHSQAEIGRRLGVSRSTVSRVEKRLGLKREPAIKPRSTPRSSAPPVEQGDSAEAEESPHVAAPTSPPVEAAEVVTGEDVPEWRDPLDRSLDRVLARTGLLDDADPIFAEAESLPRAGVLLAIPLLVRSEALQTFDRIYGNIGPAFYGLRTAVVCLFLLALLRIKRPENLKEFNPSALGRLLGLDRAPEVKTLRRKLATLAARGRGEELVKALGKARADTIDDPSVLGTLYADGHVTQYHGKHDLAQTRITTRNMAGPASTDTWINDLRGDPLFVIPSELNEDLTQTLMKAMEMARAIVGPGRRITIVFDRGGWSPALFERLIKAGFDIITYRKSKPGQKGKRHKLARSKFEERQLEADGREISYQLHDAPQRKIGRRKSRKKGEPKYLWLREVTRLREDGKQTAVITSRDDLPAEKILFLMFNRWRQENFFKYMGEEFAIDALLEYGAEPVAKGRDRPNPARKPIEKKIRKAEGELATVDQTLGALVSSNEEAQRPTVRGFKIAHSNLLRERQEAVDEILELYKARDALPKRIPADDLECLRKERKLVGQAIKALAYQAESDIARLLHPHYKRAEDEGRTLLHAAFQSAARIDVTPGELKVTIEAQSSPHRSRALAQLCAEIDAMGECFPGTGLRIRVAAEVPEPVMI